MDYQKSIDTITNELYKGGGRGQCRDLIKVMLAEDYIEPADVLDAIEQILVERKRTIKENYIIPVQNCEYFLKDGTRYACLDKDLKFSVVEKGTSDWGNVSHVMYNMPIQKAFDIIYNHYKEIK